ncbi:hypothetical protein [Companilactobacillus halodurans]|uniref:hypothetical protein n=1 Tax=Companilactobacillus halodurans TaxID=2584183 RepID=UPI001297E82F|nr:hypothetical protein [Companilactobacillus halodurans]
MIIRLLGWGLVLLVIVAIVGFISNSKEFGTKILSGKLGMYIIALLVGLYLALF